MLRVLLLRMLFPQWYYKLAHQPCVLLDKVFSINDKNQQKIK